MNFPNENCRMNFHEFPGPELSSRCIHCGSRRRSMGYNEVIEAIEAGRKVYWASLLYQVIRGANGQYLIRYSGGHSIGLLAPGEQDYERTFAQIFIQE
jgi:hypothetical protein